MRLPEQSHGVATNRTNTAAKGRRSTKCHCRTATYAERALLGALTTLAVNFVSVATKRLAVVEGPLQRYRISWEVMLCSSWTAATKSHLSTPAQLHTVSCSKMLVSISPCSNSEFSSFLMTPARLKLLLLLCYEPAQTPPSKLSASTPCQDSCGVANQ